LVAAAGGLAAALVAGVFFVWRARVGSTPRNGI
jgi:hypothetical protein